MITRDYEVLSQPVIRAGCPIFRQTVPKSAASNPSAPFSVSPLCHKVRPFPFAWTGHDAVIPRASG